jgi:hypothetical protein
MKKLLLAFSIFASVISNVFAQTEVEPNNTILQNSSSNTFTAFDTIKASITNNNPDDRDFFKIVLPYCSNWNFNIINPNGSPCVLKMYLYNAQNTSNVIINSTGTTFDFNAGIPAPVALNCGQTIYVQIDQTSGVDLGAYSLVITENAFSGFLCNVDTSTAALIPVNTNIEAKLYGYDCNGNVDVDWYKVIPPVCGVLNINIAGVNNLQEIKIECFNSSITLIANAPNVSGGANNSISVLLKGGVTYFIKISDRYGFNCGNQCTDPYDLVDDPFNFKMDFIPCIEQPKANPTRVCKGDKVSLSVSNFLSSKGKLHWESKTGTTWDSIGNSNPYLTKNVSTQTKYRAVFSGKYSTGTNFKEYTDSLTIDIYNAPQIKSVISDRMSITSGDSVVLLANHSDYTYFEWQYLDGIIWKKYSSKNPLVTTLYKPTTFRLFIRGNCNDSVISNNINISVKSSGINLQKNSTFNLYPNPSKGNFQIDFNEPISNNYTVTIYNSAGQKVFKHDLIKGNVKFQLETELPPGVYYLTIKDEQINTWQKLIIE